MMLPITVDLSSARVILVGDREAACRRLEHLDAAGAGSLEVYALNPVEALVEAAGKRLRRRLPRASEIAMAQIVFLADVPDPAGAKILRLAHNAGRLVNIEDDPRRSDFHMPSVLRRGDLTVAISTNGKSPSLAALIRRQLESRLGPEWAGHVNEIASLRRGWRDAGANPAVISRLTAEWADRQGWFPASHQRPPRSPPSHSGSKRFPATAACSTASSSDAEPTSLRRDATGRRKIDCADQPLEPVVGRTDSRAAAIDSASLPLPNFDQGSVWLVGAGPGDPGLLSMLALHAIGWADIVVYDALVDRRILRLVRPGVTLSCAGKRGGRPSPTQADISARLIQLARAGNRVLRLKGGDPCVFGRGGEEALALASAGIPFRIVPGITAGIGGLAYAGIPVTHRAANSVVTFLTGHNGAAIPANGLDWDAIARGAPVLVLYMASKHLPNIAERLMASGRRPDEPVAVISNATTPEQQVTVSSLQEIAAAFGVIEAPAIVVIGEVVKLRAVLDWVGALDAATSVAPEHNPARKSLSANACARYPERQSISLRR
jgi:uroporphyrin-III C-methyltransferase